MLFKIVAPIPSGNGLLCWRYCWRFRKTYPQNHAGLKQFHWESLESEPPGYRLDQRRLIVLHVPHARIDGERDHLLGGVGAEQPEEPDGIAIDLAEPPAVVLRLDDYRHTVMDRCANVIRRRGDDGERPH